MSGDPVPQLDAEALALFARKGVDAGPDIPQSGEANGAKVRRVLQATRDLSGSPFAALRILDLGCGEGVYAIEAALRGARVVAVDARTERMKLGAACAERHGLTSVEFVEHDVRRIDRGTFGSFDVVWVLGLLYHLDVTDAFSLLETVHSLCTRIVIIDTFVTSTPGQVVSWRGAEYEGERCREHDDGDSAEVKRARVLRSIDNTFGFRFTRDSLVRALRDCGFTSVYEGVIPHEPQKPANRVTIAAVRGAPVMLATYPWMNGISDDELNRRLLPAPSGAVS